jgi:hypothetical protein
MDRKCYLACVAGIALNSAQIVYASSPNPFSKFIGNYTVTSSNCQQYSTVTIACPNDPDCTVSFRAQDGGDFTQYIAERHESDDGYSIDSEFSSGLDSVTYREISMSGSGRNILDVTLVAPEGQVQELKWGSANPGGALCHYFLHKS